VNKQNVSMNNIRKMILPTAVSLFIGLADGLLPSQMLLDEFYKISAMYSLRFHVLEVIYDYYTFA